MGWGTKNPSKRSKHCNSCRLAAEHEATHERGRRLEAWWAEGLSYPEISQKLGWGSGDIGVELDRFRGLGFHLPYRYTTGKRKGSKFPDQVPS